MLGPNSKEPYDFSDFLNKVIMVYQDDLTVYSKCRGDHFMHLRKIFNRHRSFGISLNPKKSVFGAVEGKLLGHMVCKRQGKNRSSKSAILKEIQLPQSKKGIQSFGSIKFLLRFVPNFVEITYAISNMLKKGHDIVWTLEAKYAFKNIKQALFQALVLVIPNHS